MNLPEPECRGGYPTYQLEELLGPRYSNFQDWFYGQTGMLCTGERYNHDTKECEEACGGLAHGPVVYTWDLERFLAGGEVVD